MPVETSMYSTTPTVKFDPAGAMQSAVTLSNGMQQNKLLQGAVEMQQPAIANAKLELAQKQVGGLRQGLGVLLGNQNPTFGDITELGSTGIRQGWFTPEQFSTEVSSWPGDNAPAAARQAWVQSHYVRQLSNEQQITQMLGNPTLTNDGQTQRFAGVSPMTGVHPMQGGAMPNKLSPQDRIGGISTFQNGTPGTVPVGQRFDDFGNLRGNALTGATPSLAPLPPTVGAGAAANMQPRTMESGPMGGRSAAPKTYTTVPPSAPPAQSGTPGQAQSAMVPQAAAQPQAPGFNPTGPGIGSAGSVDLLNKDRNAAASFSADVTPLQTAIAGLDQLGPQGTGPATAKLNDLKSMAISLGVPGASGWTDNVKAYDETRKYLLQNAMKGGTGTNDQLAASIAGNPSVGISNAAASDIAKQALALRRMQHAGYLLNQTPGQEGTYADRAAQWNAQQDPRAFIVDKMSPAAKAALAKSLGPPGSPAYVKFQQSLQAAHDARVIAPGGQ